MTAAQAKEILRIYRPGSPDGGDSEVVEALSLARREPDLARWLEAHCVSYVEIRDRFKQIAVPAALKEQILAEYKLQSRILPLRRPAGRPGALAIAAALVLVLSIAAMWFQLRSPDADSKFRNRMVSTALRNYGMDLETNDLRKVKEFLATRKAPSDYSLPSALEKLTCTGCVVLLWQDRPVSMICFRSGRPLPTGEISDVFLFVSEHDFIAGGSLQIKPVNKLMTASWKEGGRTYLLATHGDEAFLRKFL